MYMNWKTWLNSLIAAAIGGASNALLGAGLMPDTFNFSHQGWINIAKLAFCGAIVPVLTLLKQSPIPGSVTDPAPGGVQGAGKAVSIVAPAPAPTVLVQATPPPAPVSVVPLTPPEPPKQ
jgi:hypothetical protein